MTTHQNHQTGNPCRTEQFTDRRGIIAKVCFDCYNHATHKEDFIKSIRLLKQLILQPSKTPALDEAYFDGFAAALETLKQERP